MIARHFNKIDINIEKIDGLTRQSQEELDMAGYSWSRIDAHRTHFTQRLESMHKHGFKGDKSLTWNELCKRREQREILGIPECKVETSALETMLIYRNRDPKSWKNGDMHPKGVTPTQLPSNNRASGFSKLRGGAAI